MSNIAQLLVQFISNSMVLYHKRSWQKSDPVSRGGMSYETFDTWTREDKGDAKQNRESIEGISKWKARKVTISFGITAFSTQTKRRNQGIQMSHRVWALWWHGGQRRLRTSRCPCLGRLGTLKTPSCPWRGWPAAGQNLETGYLSRHYIAKISLNVTLKPQSTSTRQCWHATPSLMLHGSLL